jgi:hypothetical protein
MAGAAELLRLVEGVQILRVHDLQVFKIPCLDRRDMFLAGTVTRFARYAGHEVFQL